MIAAVWQLVDGIPGLRPRNGREPRLDEIFCSHFGGVAVGDAMLKNGAQAGFPASVSSGCEAVDFGIAPVADDELLLRVEHAEALAAYC